MVKRLKILAVDDDIINLKVMKSALIGEYEVLTAMNGYEAISKIKEAKPDLILLDVMMPQLSGFEVCSIIKADPAFADIPVIFLTALDTNDGELQGLELGGIDYLTKPVNFALLKLRVRNHIAFKEHSDLVKEQRDQLARQKEELENKNTELERFTYTVSHDLKSPLITIQTYAGMIVKDLAAGNHARAQDDLKWIEGAAAKMTTLLNDLLQLSRAGKMMKEPSAIDMNFLVKDCLAQLAGPITQKQVEVSVQAELPGVLGDQHRITEVLQNLIENAIKYMGTQTAPRIEIGVRRDGKESVFFVSDNGAGVDPHHHENIFGLFKKLDAGSEGSGVGLALVRRIIEVHGGRVWVESEGAGKGSCFQFTLPCFDKSVSPLE